MPIKDLRRVCVTLADEAGIQPILDDAFELAEEVEFSFLAGIAPLGIKQVRSEAVEHGRRPSIAQMGDGEVHALADDAGVLRLRGAGQLRRQIQDRVCR